LLCMFGIYGEGKRGFTKYCQRRSVTIDDRSNAPCPALV
jgi:hypothetical protein